MSWSYEDEQDYKREQYYINTGQHLEEEGEEEEDDDTGSGVHSVDGEGPPDSDLGADETGGGKDSVTDQDAANQDAVVPSV